MTEINFTWGAFWFISDIIKEERFIILLPMARGQYSCFGFTFGGLSCHPSFYTANAWNDKWITERTCVCRRCASSHWRGWPVNCSARRARSRGTAGWRPWSRASRREKQRWRRGIQSACKLITTDLSLTNELFHYIVIEVCHYSFGKYVWSVSLKAWIISHVAQNQNLKHR